MCWFTLPMLAVLVLTERHADVAEEVILELSHLARQAASTTRTRPFLCANTASGEFALATPISINSRSSK
jgi:hypothetical protein